MDYKVIQAGAVSPDEAAEQLAERVKAAMRAGWLPLGGVSFAPDNRKIQGEPFFTIVQAVVKNATKEAISGN